MLNEILTKAEANLSLQRQQTDNHILARIIVCKSEVWDEYICSQKQIVSLQTAYESLYLITEARSPIEDSLARFS